MHLDQRVPDRVHGGSGKHREKDEKRHRGLSDLPSPKAFRGRCRPEPGSAEHRRIVGSTPYHRGAAYLDGFVDAAAVASEPAGDFHTHVKTIDGKVTKRRLDHCFVGGMLAGRVRSVSADIGELASDHFPLRIDIDLETPGIASGLAGR